jgi:hypothetical protein
MPSSAVPDEATTIRHNVRCVDQNRSTTMQASGKYELINRHRRAKTLGTFHLFDRSSISQTGAFLGTACKMRRHFVPLAALFVESYPAVLAILIIIFDAHVHDVRDAREGVEHEADERSITESDDGIHFDRIKERTRLVGGEHWRFPAMGDMLRPADRRGRVHQHDLSGQEKIELITSLQ